MDIKMIAEEYAKIFKLNNWHWYDRLEGDHIPRAQEIEKVIRSRIQELKEHHPYPDSMSYIALGRIQVSKHKLPENDDFFYRVSLLPFIVRKYEL